MTKDQFGSRLAERLASFTHHDLQVEQRSETKPDTQPLKDRLANLLSTLPDDVKSEGLSLEYIRSRLSGVTPGRSARADAVARAMRQLGWVRRRYWRENREGFYSRWFPPIR